MQKLNHPFDDVVPRFDLREPAFRKYEAFIAQACKGTIEVDPAERGMTAKTFRARFMDAVLAFKRYRYPSEIILSTYNVDDIQALELVSGKVRLWNPRADAIGSARDSMLKASDRESILTMIKVYDEWVWDEEKALRDRDSAFPQPSTFNVAFSSAEERNWLSSLGDTHPVAIRVTKEPNIFNVSYNPWSDLARKA
jgi:hypothetical protein